MSMLAFASLILLFALSFGDDDVIKATSSPCGQAAKAESYLETAAAMIDKVRENFPSGGREDCSCPQKPMDCEEVSQCGHNRSGVFQIWPRSRIMSGNVDVYCDMQTDGGGWTVIQRRGDFKRPFDYFFKDWHQYKTGFGDIRRDFWIGNDNIYALTNQRKYYLRIDLRDFENNTRYAFYDQFWIDSESQSYKLHVYDFSGDAGDSLHKTHYDQRFSTYDRDNDNSTGNCAEKQKGGWWFTSCGSSNLNGLYKIEGYEETGSRLVWGSWKGAVLKWTEMKIRPFDFKTSLLDMNVEPK